MLCATYCLVGNRWRSEEGRTPFPFRAVDSMHLEAMFKQQRTDPVTLSFTHSPWPFTDKLNIPNRSLESESAPH